MCIRDRKAPGQQRKRQLWAWALKVRHQQKLPRPRLAQCLFPPQQQRRSWQEEPRHEYQRPH
eukprot:9919084-Alexandrium_andersonii.AAC.1